MKLFAIGDIHGCLYSLKDLIQKIGPSKEDALVFTGDYVDRGPFSCQVLDYIFSLSDSCNVIPLMGNHEEMFLFAENNSQFDMGMLIQNGIRQTIRSYESSEKMKEHLSRIKNFKKIHVTPEYVFVHAGVMPGIPLEKQKEDDFLWVRHEFIGKFHGLPQKVVHGHTPIELSGLTLDKPSVNIDTGCVYGYYLTAVELTKGEFTSVKKHNLDDFTIKDGY